MGIIYNGAMQLKVMSFNIRFQNPKDGPNDWPNRRDLFAEVVGNFAPHMMGTQEGREPQLRDIENLLANYKISDAHRDWIKERMYPSIYYNPKFIDILESGDIWLSETPDVPGSVSFGSAFPRTSTWAKAQSKKEEKSFLIADAHLDHVNEETRVEQIRVLMEELTKVNSEGLPLILIGDFNANPQSSVRTKLHQTYGDLYDPWHDLGHAEATSFHKFQGEEIEGARINWMMLDRRLRCEQLELDKTAVPNNDHILYPSDHYPLKGIIHL